MERNTLASLTPVIALCTICGFSMPFLRKPKLQSCVIIYCLAVTVLHFTIMITALSIALYSSVNSVPNIFDSCLWIMSPLVLVYYETKFFMCLEKNRSLFGNIVYVDRSLESLHFSVPHTRNKIEFSLPLIVLLVLFILLFYEAYYVSFFSEEFDFIMICMNTCAVHIDVCHIILSTLLYSITIILKQRLRHVRCAFEMFAARNKRNVAWSDCASVAVVGQPRDGNFLTEMRDTYRLIGSLYRITYETWVTVSQLYSVYFCYYILALIIWISLQIIFTTIDKSIEYFVFSVAMWIFIYVVILFIYESITSEFKILQDTLNDFYYKTSLNKMRNETLLLVYQSAHRENKFDCGFVKVEFAMFYIIIDFTSLIVFSVL